MARFKLNTMGWASLLVLGLTLYYYLIEVPTHSEPNFGGYKVTPPTTKRDLLRTPRNTPQPETKDIGLPSELRDYSKYRKRMLDRGRTEEQISRDYARAIRKYLDKDDTGVYQKLRDEGIDPEYDLNEMDESLDELVPEY